MWQPFEHAGLVVPRWRLVTIARDWTASKYEGTIRPVEPIEIPLIEPERVEAYMRERIALYTAAEMCDDAGLPECSRDETWNGRRCAQWCDAASVCKQFGARKGQPVEPQGGFMSKYLGVARSLAYIATIFGANYAIEHVGFVTVAPGLQWHRPASTSSGSPWY
jgi:hypothetical protein